MQDTRIKICGITTPVDARVCRSFGADYLGLIFAPSERRVTADVARQIRQAVPDAMLVGVFMDAPLDDVADLCKDCRLNIVQLHGSETPEYTEALHRRVSLPVIKTVSFSQIGMLARIGEYRSASYFLFDLDKRRNGHALDELQDQLWRAAADVRRQGYRLFLGGGLTERTVRDAIRRVSPHAVDIARGVERKPGVKDRKAVETFIRRVRS